MNTPQGLDALYMASRWQWRSTPPTEAGFYFFSGAAMYNRYGPGAVQICELSKYANREGFNVQFLQPPHPVQEAIRFDDDLDKLIKLQPNGMWAGPFPQPFFKDGRTDRH